MTEMVGTIGPHREIVTQVKLPTLDRSGLGRQSPQRADFRSSVSGLASATSEVGKEKTELFVEANILAYS